MKDRYLLIGGAGFIGMNLAIHLADIGYAITVFDCLENPFDISYRAKIKYLQGNYFEEDISDEILREQDRIILLACSVAPKTSMEVSEVCYQRDVVRMIGLLEQMRRCRVKGLILISSGGTVYGNQEEQILSEDMQTFPINHYGIMKLTQEKIMMMYNRLYEMKNVVFRLANPYGPGQRVSSGIGAVTAFLDNILQEKDIIVYGKGEITRDYIFILDVVNMISLFLEQEGKAKGIPIYNVGTGKGTSIMQVIKVIEEITGKTAKILFCEERKIDVKRNVLDTRKLRSVIGVYKCLTLKEGIGEYYKIIKREK